MTLISTPPTVYPLPINGLMAPLPGAIPIAMQYPASGSGTQTLSPSIPSGFKMWAIATIFHNTTATNVTASGFFLKRGARTYRLRPSSTIPGNGQNPYGIPYVLHPNDTLDVVTLTSGVAVTSRCWLIPDTGPLILFATAFGESTLANTIYTCPANKIAIFGWSFPSIGGMLVTNRAGGTRVINFHTVPNGGSPDASNITQRLSLNNDTVFLPATHNYLTAGQSFAVTVDIIGNDMMFFWELLRNGCTIMQSLVISIAIPLSIATVSDWRAQLIDETGASVGSPVSTGFVNVGSGFYQWYYASFDDDFQGGVKFYSNANPTAILGLVSINPLEATIFPSGANEITFTVNNSVTLLPIDGATVWITTDLAGTNVIWTGSTDAFGVARNVNGEKPFLNTGTYYGWVQDSGYTDTNPTTLNVSP